MRVSRDFALISKKIYQGIFLLKQANKTSVSVTASDVNQMGFISTAEAIDPEQTFTKRI
jgi:hypothetical protein